MDWYIIYANGAPFGVFAESLEAATRTAAVHLAWRAGVKRIERLTELARLGVE